MSDNPDIHVKSSKYESWLSALYDAHSQTAESAVKKAFELLAKEGKKPIEIRAIVEHDLGKIWKTATLQQYMPKDAFDQEMQALRTKRSKKQEAARKIESNEPVKEIEKLLEITVAADGSQSTEPPVITPKVAKKIVDVVKDQAKEIEKLKASIENTANVETTKAMPVTADIDPVATKLVKQAEIDRLREKVGKMHDKLQPFEYITEKELWGKKYHFRITCNPMDQTADFEIVKKADLKKE